MSDEAVRQAWRVIQRCDRFPLPVDREGLVYNPKVVAAVSVPRELSQDEDRWWQVDLTLLLAQTEQSHREQPFGPLIMEQPRFNTRQEALDFCAAFHLHWAKQS